MKFTDRNVADLELQAGKTELLIFDEALPGFGVRLRAGGKRSWIAQYRTNRQQRRLTLGSVGTVDAIEARKRAKATLARAQLGQDPQGEKTAARAPRAREITLAEVVDRYLPFAERKLKPSTYSGIVLHMRWNAGMSLPN